MFRRLWRTATGADEPQPQQQSANKTAAQPNGHSAAAHTHADNQAAAATLHPNNLPYPSSTSASSNSHPSSAAPPPAIALPAGHLHTQPAASSSSPSPVSSPAAAVVVSETAGRPVASSSFPVGEKFYGLENSNNVCYSNSVLQALYACRPFRQHLLVYYEDNKRRKPDDSLLLSLAALFYRIQTSRQARGVVSPAPFVKKLKRCNEQFDSTAHQDAQEFLIFLLNDISDTIKAEKDKAVRDRLLAAQQQLQQQSAAGAVGGAVGGVDGASHGATKKFGFASLFSSSSSTSSPVPSPAAATSQHSLVSSTAPPASIASSSAASHSSSHPSIHTIDGVDQLPNMSALSAATAAGSNAINSAHDTHEQQHSITQSSSTTSASSSSSSTASTHSTSSAATTDGATSNHSSPSTPSSSATSQPPVLASTASSTVSSTATAAASSASAAPSVSWVQSLFEGTLTNLTSCLRCGSVSERDESFLDLSVDLLEHHSLSSCLRSFSHDEMLSGNDKYLCDACGCRQEAVKSLRLKSTPAILILHMKRFKYQEAIRTFAKLTYRVTFPLSLRLPATTGPGLLYSLTAVVVHIGNGARSGHYVCMCRGSSGQFYLYDDTTITAIGEAEVQATFGSEMGGSHQDGYLLFYSQEPAITRPIAMHTKPPQQQPSRSSSATQAASVDGEKAATEHVASKTGSDTSASGISVAG